MIFRNTTKELSIPVLQHFILLQDLFLNLRQNQIRSKMHKINVVMSKFDAIQRNVECKMARMQFLAYLSIFNF